MPQTTSQLTVRYGSTSRTPARQFWTLLLMPCLLCGCGTTISRNATEQLLTSDAVDQAVAQIDFRALSGKRVFFDTKYIKPAKGVGFVNADYIISSLRQQMVAADCLLQDHPEDAEYIVEARVGALGNDNHEVNYGLPASNLVNTASTLVPTMPAIPPIPELSLAKKNAQFGTAKIGVFAFDRKTRHPVWQSGISRSKSTSKDTWILGMGPFQQGTIRDGTRFAGSRIALPFIGRPKHERARVKVPYDKEVRFPLVGPEPSTDTDSVQADAKTDSASTSQPQTAASEPQVSTERPQRATAKPQAAAGKQPTVPKTPNSASIPHGGLTDPVELFPDEMKLFSKGTEFLPSEAEVETLPPSDPVRP